MPRRCGVAVTHGVRGPHLKRVVSTSREVGVGLGDVQVGRVESWPTNLHLNVEPGSLEVNSKVTVVPITLPIGGLVMAVSGGVVSAASARFSVVATNANRASNGTSRIKRLFNAAPLVL